MKEYIGYSQIIEDRGLSKLYSSVQFIYLVSEVSVSFPNLFGLFDVLAHQLLGEAEVNETSN